MIPSNITRNVESTFTGFEEQDFTILGNGKAFRVLLDTIYTNKIKAVIRETATNAYDSHIMAGRSNKPFIIQLPNAAAPTFRVRDFGTSMTHEEVMHLYTTVFQSSKEDTNAQVGQLGLGSKSPFAYTDSFSVIAYLDGEKRTYLASIQGDGKPTILLIGREATTEPDGFEVSFPVQAQHFQEFAEEAASVCRGFDRLPDVVGNTIKIDKPIFAHGNWRIFKKQGHVGYGQSTAVSLRQGCVIYPITENQLRVQTGLSNGYEMIVDVPIGTVEVAANREALSLDDRTKKEVIDAFKNGMEDFRKWVEGEISQAKTLLEAEKAYYNWRQMWYNSNQTRMKWQGQDLKGYIEFPPGTLPKILDSKEKRLDQDSGGNPEEVHFSISNLDQLKFVLDQNTRQIPRRRMRIKQWRKDEYGGYGHEGKMFHLVDATPTQIAFLKKSLGLKDSQFYKVEDMDDVPVTAKVPGAKGTISRSGVYRVNQHGSAIRMTDTDPIDPDFYWVAIDKMTDSQYVRIDGLGSCELQRLYPKIATFLQDVDEPKLPVYYLTPRAVKRLSPKPEHEVHTFVKNAVQNGEAKLLLRAKALSVAQYIGSYAIPDLRRLSPENAAIWNEMCFDLGFDFTKESYHTINRLSEYVVQVLGDKRETAEKQGERYGEQLAKRYPMLFAGTPEAILKGYITKQKGMTP